MRLRVILLEKIASLDKKCFTGHDMLPKNRLGPWVVLGHFDAIYTYPLDLKEKHVFQTISKHNQKISTYNSSNFYFHPLYLLTDEDDTVFWEKSTWCMAVARIHCTSCVDIASLLGSLEEELLKEAVAYGCCCQIYHTMELSDLVLAIKSDKISNLLHFTLRLRKYSCIGKVYTYCGIDYAHITKTVLFPDSNDNIPTITMRFSVSDFSKVDEQLAAIKRALDAPVAYSIVGVDDVALTSNNLPLIKLVQFYRSSFIWGYDTSVPLNNAFSDVTTRAGITLEGSFPCIDLKGQGSCDNGKRLQAACQRLVEYNEKIQNLVRNGNYGIPVDSAHNWLKPLSELTKALFRMGRTPVLDKFVYLMLPGATVFLERIYRCLEQNGGLPEKMAEYFQRFVRGWSHLMEHVMRIEGQLTHHPEMRPIIYDIPIIMLEYTLAFLNQATEVLLSSDSRKKRIHFLLIPNPGSWINSVELFQAEGDLPGLVLVDIPFHMLYNPASVLSALVHETSHFVGEDHRKRDLRTEYFGDAAAVLLAKLAFVSYDKRLISEIAKWFKEKLCSCTSAYQMRNIISDWSENPFTLESYSAFVRNVLLAKGENNGNLAFEMDLVKLKEIHMPEFRLLLNDLCTLFREIYADICMLYLLPLSEEDYVRGLVEELTHDPKDPYEMFAIRIFVVLTAAKRGIPSKIEQVDQKIWNRVYGELTELNKDIRLGREGVSLLPRASVIFLEKYASACYESLSCKLNNYPNVAELRKMFESISSGLDYDKLLATINSYRLKVLEK